LIPEGTFQDTSQDLQERKGESVRDQLADLEFELNKVVLSHILAVRSWDIDQGGLRLKYEARRFAW